MAELIKSLEELSMDVPEQQAPMVARDDSLKRAKDAESMDVAHVQSLLLNAFIEANHRFRGKPSLSTTDVQHFYGLMAYLLRDRQLPQEFKPARR